MVQSCSLLNNLLCERNMTLVVKSNSFLLHILKQHELTKVLCKHKQKNSRELTNMKNNKKVSDVS